jgi:hypothetical protein
VIKWILSFACLIWPVLVDATEILGRKVEMRFEQTPVNEALAQIAQQASFDLAYNANIISTNQKVTLHAQNWTVKETLYRMLGNTYSFKESGNALIIKKIKASETILIGYVKDPKTGARVAGATVYDQKTLRATTTDENGFYQLRTKANTSVVVSRLAYRDTILSVRSLNQQIVDLNLEAVPVEVTPKPDLKLSILRAEYKLRKTFAAQLDCFPYFKPSRDLYRVFQLSLVPRVGTNRNLDAKVENDFSVNILLGQSKSVAIFEASGFGAFTESSVRGLQIAGFFNFNNGNTTGLQVAGALNTTNDTLVGSQISGFFSYARATAGTASFQISGAASLVKTGSVATQVSGFYSQAEQVTGLQMASISNIATRVQGFQWSAGLNAAQEVDGVQLALGNHAKKMKGVQIGLYNQTKSCDCIQIGLLNRIGKRWLPIVNIGRG